MSKSSNESGHDYSGDKEPTAFDGDSAASSSSSTTSPKVVLVREDRPLDVQPLNTISPVDDSLEDDMFSLNEMIARMRRSYRVGSRGQAVPSSRGNASGHFPSLIDEEISEDAYEGEGVHEDKDVYEGEDEQEGDEEIGEEEEEGAMGRWRC